MINGYKYLGVPLINDRSYVKVVIVKRKLTLWEKIKKWINVRWNR